jgi:hypothetical protein
MTFPDNGPESSKKGTPTWLKVVGIGCGGVIVLLLVIAGLVAGNWPKLTGYYQQAKSTFSDMMTIRTALQKKYGADVRLTAKRESGVEGSILSIALVNAALMDRVNVDSDDGRRAALDVATAARDAVPPNGRYDNYEVVFVRERGAAGVQMSRSWSFRFKATDLPTNTKAGS